MTRPELSEEDWQIQVIELAPRWAEVRTTTDVETGGRV
jgi:hypothetical protein